jgi:hypothetical protein
MHSIASTVHSTASTLWSETMDTVINFNIPRIAAPWQHGIPLVDKLNESTSNTTRSFNLRSQRLRIFVNYTSRWFITTLICTAIVAVLISYSRLDLVTQAQRHAFNALVMSLSILLSLNLAASLSGYARMMRWRWLANRYWNIQDFELILSSDSQMQVLRFLWLGRSQGRWCIPNRIQFFCVSWLSINIAFQVFTALVGLTYSIDISSDFVETEMGMVSIVDLRLIYPRTEYESAEFEDQAGAANAFGIEGGSYGFMNNTPVADQVFSETYYTNSVETTFWYRFMDQNPYDNNQTPDVTLRTISTTAICEEFKVLSGGYANSDYVTYLDTNLEENVTTLVPLPLAEPGCGTGMSHENKTCGPRCTTTMLLLSADNKTGSAPHPLWFQCNNTVSQVNNTDRYADSSHYQMADEQARLWAGAIGFSGFSKVDAGSDLEYVLYDYETDWSPNSILDGGANSAVISEIMMWFTAGAIAVDDNLGPRVNVTGLYPIQGQVVNVDWKWSIATLAGIPGCQFLILIAVLIWANKVIIKDTSYSSTALMLRRVVEKLGDKGSLLTGDEIAETLGNYRLKYALRDLPQSGTQDRGLEKDVVRHVDFVEEEEGLNRADARMVSGLYD